MPYITNDRREAIDNAIDDLVGALQDIEVNEGDLNYTVTRIVTESLEIDNAPRYAKINTVMGVLECVKLELYRRVGSLYEDEAIEKNGDIGCFKRFKRWLAEKIVGRS